MFNSINRGAILSARTMARKSTAWATFARDAVRGLLTTAHHTMSLFGFGVLIVIGVMFLRPDLAQRTLLPSLTFANQFVTPQLTVNTVNNANTALDTPTKEFKPTTPSAAVIPVANIEPHTSQTPIAKVSEKSKLSNAADSGTLQQQKIVSSWLSKRYRVAGDAANMLVASSYATAKEVKIDPLLILAVMAIESGFNPFAESPMGAQGLMQVMSKVHHDKFQELGGIKEALNPHTNIRVGALILKDYVTRGGSIEAGLKSYVGASAFETDAGYGSRVMAEYARLKEVASGKSVSAQPPRRAEEAKAATSDEQLAAL